MNKITFPLGLRMQGSAVGDLQDALQLLLKRGLLLASDEATRSELSAALEREQVEQTYGEATRKLVGSFQEEQRLQTSGEVDEPTANALNALVDAQTRFSVSGQVRYGDDTPGANITVRAYNRDVGRDDQLLGEAKTDEQGKYQISYTAAAFADRGKTSADLFVRIFTADGTELQTSDIRFNASSDEKIDVLIQRKQYGGTSEYERVKNSVTPLLRDVPLSNLQPQDVEYLAAKTGIGAQQIALLAQSAKLAQETGNPAELYYATLRITSSTDLTALLSQAPNAIVNTLESAVAANVIPTPTREQARAFLDKLLSVTAADALKAPRVDGRATLGDLLSIAVPDHDKQQIIAELWVKERGSSSGFYEAVRARPEFQDASEVQHLQWTLELGDLTGDYLPLVEELQRRAGTDPNLQQLYALASYDRGQWEEVVRVAAVPADIPGATPDVKAQNYAQLLYDTIEARFPTAVIASRIQQGKFPVADSGLRDDLNRFFQSNPQFKFGDEQLPTRQFLEGPDARFDGVANTDSLKSQLKQVDRLFKLTPKSEEVSALINGEMHSATAIAHMREQEFINTFGVPLGGNQAAASVYRKAKQVYDTALLLYARHHPALNQPQPYVISNDATGRASTAFPADLQAMFGSIDLCDCVHCASIYSPAAYFVDILRFLSIGPRDPRGQTPLDVLLSRRPDLAEIELTCENTDTTLPYVDLVNEVLENVVWPLVPREVPLTTGQSLAAQMDQRILPPAVKQSLTGLTPPLSNQVLVDLVESGRRWRIVDGARRWLVEYTLTGLGVTVSEEPSRHIELESGSTAVSDLDQARVPPEVQSALTKHGYLRPVNAVVSTIQAGLSWQLNYGYQLTIQLQLQLNPVLTLTTNNVMFLQIPLPFGSDIPSRLDAGILPPELEGQLGMPALKVAVVVVVPGQQWNVTQSEQATVTLTPAKMSVTTLALQTSGTSEELRAEPEHTNALSYDRLAAAVYPWRLPFNLWLEEARVYLNHLGVSRCAGMETFSRGTLADVLLDALIVNEYLGLSETEADIILGNLTHDSRPVPIGSNADRPWDFWGFATSAVQIPDPSGSGPPLTGTWDAVLKRTDVFLKQSGISYIELLELLDTYFINPLAVTGRALSLRSANAQQPDSCVLNELVIDGLDIPTLKKMHRFVRLWRRLGWALRDLDKAITALQPKDGNGQLDITSAFLRNVSHAQRLRTMLNVPVPIILSWWANVDTAVYHDYVAEGQPEIKSRYEELFKNKSVLNPADAAFDLNSACTELANPYNSQATAPGPTISEHRAVVLASVGMSNAELSLLIPSVVKDELTLANLSLIARIASFAKAVHLSVREFLILKDLTGLDPLLGLSAVPFSTLDTLLFVQSLQRVRSSGLSIDEINYLLRHIFSPVWSGAPTQDEIALLLDEIRRGLQKIAAENAFSADTADPTGDLTRKKLAGLNWDPDLIERLMGMLSNNANYEATLSVLPSGLEFPEALKTKISFDAVQQTLRFTGSMTTQEQSQLKGLSNESAYSDALDELFNAPRTFVSRQMKLFEPPVFSAPLATLPADIVFPDTLKNKIYHDASAKVLCFVGVMTDLEKAALLSLSSGQGYSDAINSLFAAPNTLPAEFISAADVSQWFDTATPVEQKFRDVLSKLLPHLRQSQSEAFVKQKVASTLKLEAQATENLLIHWIKSPTTASQPSISDFLTPSFTESNLDVPLTAAGFPGQFKVFHLLHKIALLVQKLKITSGQLTLVFDYAADAQWLDFNSLPTDPSEPAASFEAWARLVDLFALRDKLPNGEVVLSQLWKTARDPLITDQKWLEQASELLDWNLEDLRFAAGVQGFALTFPNDYKDERVLERLKGCVDLCTRLGMSAAQAWALTKPALVEDDARMVKHAVKAKYEPQEWFERAKSLRDVLRERQRAALVDYLVSTKPMRDASDLYEQYLIDVEMDPCMLTSRLKQAINSVQLFVQRCLMKLERNALMPTEADEWRTWRKQYRVWEANRKIFLYPENWIEPELRNDKSPFFKELENELLQSDVTDDTAEIALLHYLEKLDQVARLEIIGMFREQEPEDLYAHTSAIDRLHVFGRSLNTPHVYFYRRLEKGTWTAWERVDLDIEGEHLLPVIWNRRLHLFWPIFTQKAYTPSAQEREAHADARKYWKIQLAWSEYRQNKWQAKKVSNEGITHPTVEDRTPQETFSFLGTTFLSSDILSRVYLPCISATELAQPPTGNLPPQDSELHMAGPLESIGGTAYDPVNGNRGVPNVTIKLSKKTQQTSGNGESTTVSFVYQVIQECMTNDKGQYQFAGYFFPGDVKLEAVGVDKDGQNVVFSKEWALQDNRAYTRNFAFEGRPSSQSALPVTIRTYGTGYFYVTADGEMKAVTAQGPQVNDSPQGTQREGMFYVEQPQRLDDSLYLSTDTSLLVFEKTPQPFTLLPLHQTVFSPSQRVYFYRDETRVYHLSPSRNSAQIGIYSFFHPYIRQLLQQLNMGGISKLFALENQSLGDIIWVPKPTGSTQVPVSREFWNDYVPAIEQSADLDALPQDAVDFNFTGAYALYNWELFFHTPFLIATRLSDNQRFEEAQKWFHYIFDPTSSASGGAERFWQFRPFHDLASKPPETLADLLRDAKDLQEQVLIWQQNPFKPHVIARHRISAYMKAVVMKYIDNLLAWGDMLFRRETIEAINEATQLYVLAAQILGRRPERIPPRAEPTVQTFNALRAGKDSLDAFSNAMVQIEDFVFPSARPGSTTSQTLEMPYFCLPSNDQLVEYWDRVADRLFKVRHCMNIEGIVRELPLFEPPIPPGLLVRAAAAGVDLSSVLNEINAVPPHYRFNVMVQKALELTADVKALGASLLTAIEKRDAETLALLRSGHEMQLLQAVRQTKEQQSKEASESLNSLYKSRETVNARLEYYRDIKFMTEWETANVALMGGALAAQIVASIAEGLAAPASAASEETIGAAGIYGTPVATITYGGQQAGDAAASVARVSRDLSTIANTGAAMGATLGAYWRRWDEWKLQEKLAQLEIKQLDKQIAAAEIRVVIAEQELTNHDLQIENAQQADRLMHDKYSNQELYDWMVRQLSSVYFQSYQLAYDVAKRAEGAYRHELGLSDSRFVQFGYWDNLKKGLLAGEKLHYDLRRMELGYLDQNRRDLELTKHVSLRQLNPLALLTLKATGTCQVMVPEWLYDLECAGHYMRRIKNVALSIPSVVGPYTSVNCTLSLLKSSLRKSSIGDDYQRKGPEDDRFIDYIGTVQSIVTSTGQNDSGMFETNLRDERFLPFEGTGAESTWKLDLPKDYPSFDYATISDVILHIRYTARQGVDPTKVNVALDHLFQQASQSGLALLFSLRHDFPTEWSGFVNGTRDFTATIRKNYFPYFTQGRRINLDGLELYFFDGKDVSKHHGVQDDWSAKSNDLNDESKQAFAFTTPADDPAGSAPVLTRTADAEVFVIIRYSFA